MKNLANITGRLFLTFGLCWISISSNSQDIKLSRQEQKESKKNEMAANFKVLETLLESRKFILKSDYIQNDFGSRMYVLSSLNFIKVDSLNAVIQTGSSSGLGYNGVGGTTAEGHMDNWKLIKNFTKLSYSIQFTLVTTIGIYDINMSVNADNNAHATIRGLTPGMLIFEGHLQSINNSTIFKGQTF
jgi:hypothetical protein